VSPPPSGEKFDHAIRALMHRAAREGEHDPDRISFTRSLRVVRRQVADQAAFSPGRLARDAKVTLAELLHRLLPSRRRRANPRVIKRKVAGWPLKRAQHYVSRHPPLAPDITIVAATKTKRVKRTKTPQVTGIGVSTEENRPPLSVSGPTRAWSLSYASRSRKAAERDTCMKSPSA
jgi:hypothetical protein